MDFKAKAPGGSSRGHHRVCRKTEEHFFLFLFLEGFFFNTEEKKSWGVGGFVSVKDVAGI